MQQKKTTMAQQNMFVDWQSQLKGKIGSEKSLPAMQYHLHQLHKPENIINSFKEMHNIKNKSK